MLQNIISEQVEQTGITGTTNSDSYDMSRYEAFSIQNVIDVNTASAKTFDSGVAQVTTLTFLAQGDTDSGDYVVIYDTAGNPWAVAADLTGTDPEPTGAVWDAIPAAQRGQADLSAATTAATVAAAFEVAFDALTSVPFATDDSAADGTMLITMTLFGLCDEAEVYNADDSGDGTIAEVLTTPGATEVDPTANTVTIPSHGLPTGLKGQLTTTGTLPGGLSLATDYFIIAVDDDTVSFATTLQNALDGTAVNITNQGAASSVNTFTPTALAGATIKYQISNDDTNWSDYASATAITADATNWFLGSAIPSFRYVRWSITLTAGSISTVNNIYGRGYGS